MRPDIGANAFQVGTGPRPTRKAAGRPHRGHDRPGRLMQLGRRADVAEALEPVLGRAMEAGIVVITHEAAIPGRNTSTTS